MKDKMTIEYTDSDFRQAIEERFFSGDRLAQFPFMNVERQALWLLWDAKEIEFFGYRYDSRWIRRNLMENLTPDMLDFALRCAKIVHPRVLARMIFFFLITGEEMAARHARGEFTKQNFTECYERFRNESEFQFVEQRNERRYKYAI